MEIKLILLQLIAHLLSDFIFQPQSWSNKKEIKIFTSLHIYHVIIVGVLSYLLSFDVNFWRASFLLAFIHFLTDVVKSKLKIKDVAKDYFFTDQLVHFISIVVIVMLYTRFYGINFIFNPETKIIVIIGGFIFCTKPANIFIKYIFKAFKIETPKESLNKPDESSLPNAGKLIGITERFLTLTLIIMGQYEAVGLIIAAKSILRFKGTQKSEYVLVGTLLSFSIASFLGIFINLIN